MSLNANFESFKTTIESIPEMKDNNLTIDDNLMKLLSHIANSVERISQLLQTFNPKIASGINNSFGDTQLKVDVETERIIFDELKISKVCYSGSSEESPQLVDCRKQFESETYKQKYQSVAFDPLDGSSIIDSNFAVGSIFGIWQGGLFVGKKGSDQIASVIAVYGPRCTITVSYSNKFSKNGVGHSIMLTLHGMEWKVSNDCVNIDKSGKVFAPGNLRATFDNPNQLNLVNWWIGQKQTLRQTGGLVPDVQHILVKGKGIFANVASPAAEAKLRLLYELMPMAHMMECSGGCSSTSEPLEDYPEPVSILDIRITEYETKMGVILGSHDEVKLCLSYLFILGNYGSNEQQRNEINDSKDGQLTFNNKEKSKGDEDTLDNISVIDTVDSTGIKIDNLNDTIDLNDRKYDDTNQDQNNKDVHQDGDIDNTKDSIEKMTE